MSETVTRCWREIGVWGARECPELAKVIHCRNCGVFRAAGRRVLDTRTSTEKQDRSFSEDKQRASQGQTVLVFLLGDERLALPAAYFQEVCRVPRIHRVPHRSDTVFRGVVPVRGRLTLCVSLGVFLGVVKGKAEGNALLAVVARPDVKVAFPVTSMLGVHRVADEALSERPATLAGKLETYVQGVFLREGRSVGLLDPETLLSALRRRIAP